MRRVAGLSFSFGTHAVFDGAEIALPDRGLVAVTGSNGVGKTTLLRLLGRVYACRDTAANRDIERLGLVYLDTGYLTLDTLTVRELFVLMAGELKGVSRIELMDSALISPGMWNTRVGALSLGQRQRCVLATACSLHRVDGVLLDEPFNGLDRSAVGIARDLLASRARDQLVVFATHDSYDVSSFADSVLHVAGPDSVTLRTARPDDVGLPGVNAC